MTDDQSSSRHPQQQRVGGDAGVGDQHLDRAVLLLDLREGGVDGLRVGDVARHVEGPLRGAAAAVGDGDLVAVGEERLGDGAADAAVAAGDEDGSGRCRCCHAHGHRR